MSREHCATFQESQSAIEMIRAGYSNAVVAIQLGLTPKQVRRIATGITSISAGEANYRQQRIKHGTSLIRSNEEKVFASLLMALYYRYGGPDIYDSVDITALNQALQFFRIIALDTLAAPSADPLQFPNPTEAWCLAAALRSGEALLEPCASCRTFCYELIGSVQTSDCQFCPGSTLFVSGRPEHRATAA